MINKIKNNVYQLHFNEFGSCVYIINKKILIDTSSLQARDELLADLTKLKIDPKEISIILLTHNHYDHVENIEIFPNAKIYSPEKTNENTIIKEIPEIKIIKTPGHCPENKCFLYKDILFSGDTIFHHGGIGRMDLPGGSEKQMIESLKKLEKINYKILCPGHI